MSGNEKNKEAMMVAKKAKDLEPSLKVNSVFKYSGNWYVSEKLDQGVMDVSCYRVERDGLDPITPFDNGVDTDRFLDIMANDAYDAFGNPIKTPDLE